MPEDLFPSTGEIARCKNSGGIRLRAWCTILLS